MNRKSLFVRLSLGRGLRSLGVKRGFLLLGCIAGFVTASHAQLVENQFDRIEGIQGSHPEIGMGGMRFLAPDLLEVAHINTKAVDVMPVSWNFANAGEFVAPDPASWSVSINGQPLAATAEGFRRRVLVARTGVRDVRIDQRLIIRLASPVVEGATVQLQAINWEPETTRTYQATLSPERRSPAIHINHGGYLIQMPKQAKVGYFLGTSGEMPITATTFQVVDAQTGAVVFSGNLTPSLDSGFSLTPLPYRQVFQADFSALNVAGRYQLQVQGLGRSLPFTISAESSLFFVRAYATGLLNQRCGFSFGLPYSRHGHPACHTAPAEIPTSAAEFKNTWDMIAAVNSGWTGVAPRLISVETQLYPIVKQGTLDVSGGHHDAGDYSKYTINSAHLIHSLAFAADAFPGVGELDNMGIPESGDGKSDVLQIALHEARFLAKLQDDDGGFFFIVYPKNRKYENNVLPQHGDPQVVWPKNTSGTAAAVGALADIASSPLFQAQYPAEAAQFLAQARAGWNFLMQAIATHGLAGSYQRLTHYGDVFGHQDELAWAAASMYAATGEAIFQEKLMEWYDPLAPATIRWSWWRLFEGYGCAARAYAFAPRVGKRTVAEMNATYLGRTESIILARGNDVRNWTNESAYGMAFDWNSKRFNSAGWFFPLERAYDILVADQIQASPANLEAVISNINYEFGTNPLNLCYLTGTGSRSQQEIVHQYADNDDRALPPSGIPIGSLQSGFAWNGQYKSELASVNVPSDWANVGRYPFYDRWADTFNVNTELVVPQQGRGLATVAAIAARNADVRAQPWNPINHTPTISFIGLTDGYVTVGQPVTATLTASNGLDLSQAVVIWETTENQPVRGGPSVVITPTRVSRQWIEAEAVLADGKRICARAEFGVKSATPADPLPLTDQTVALYRFDTGWNDATPNQFHLTVTGNPQITPYASGWATDTAVNRAVRFYGNNDRLTATIPDSVISPGTTATPIAFEFRICPMRMTNYGIHNRPLLALTQSWAFRFGLSQNMWSSPCLPSIGADGVSLLSPAQWDRYITAKNWNQVRISRDSLGQYELVINGEVVSTGTKTSDFGGTGSWLLEIGNFDGYIDDFRITGLPNHGNAAPPPATGGGTGGTGDTGGTGGSGGTGGTGGGTPAPGTTVPTEGLSPARFEIEPDSFTTALYHFDGNFLDAGTNQLHLTSTGSPTFVPVTDAAGVVRGQAVRFTNFGDALLATIPDALVSPGTVASPLTLEAWIRPRGYRVWGNETAGIMFLNQNWDSNLGLRQDKWLTPSFPSIRSGQTEVTPQAEWTSFITPDVWQHLQVVRHSNGTTSVRVNGRTIKTVNSTNAWGRTNAWSFVLGNIDADIDELLISRSERAPLAVDEIRPDSATLALYQFNGNALDSGPNALHLTTSGVVLYDNSSVGTGWMSVPSGSSAYFHNLGDRFSVSVPNSLISPGTTCNPITIEARIYPIQWLAYGVDTFPVLHFLQHWDSMLGLTQDRWLLPAAPKVMAGSHTVLSQNDASTFLVRNQWNRIKICRTALGTTRLTINGMVFPEMTTPMHYARTTAWQFTIGNFRGYVDQVHVTSDER